MIFACIRDHLVPEFTVRDCCRVLRVSTAGYYRWLGHPIGKRQTRREELTAKIRIVHESSRRIYSELSRGRASGARRRSAGECRIK